MGDVSRSRTPPRASRAMWWYVTRAKMKQNANMIDPMTKSIFVLNFSTSLRSGVSSVCFFLPFVASSTRALWTDAQYRDIMKRDVFVRIAVGVECECIKYGIGKQVFFLSFFCSSRIHDAGVASQRRSLSRPSLFLSLVTSSIFPEYPSSRFRNTRRGIGSIYVSSELGARKRDSTSITTRFDESLCCFTTYSGVHASRLSLQCFH